MATPIYIARPRTTIMWINICRKEIGVSFEAIHRNNSQIETISNGLVIIPIRSMNQSNRTISALKQEIVVIYTLILNI